MDRNEAIDLLSGGAVGVTEWNRRRAVEQFHPPDLCGADLGGARMASANLAYTNLERATLEDTYLSQADFYRANLSGANLARADLQEARLHDTNLSSASLRGARFLRTTLAHCDFRGADLEGASLVEAWLIGGQFAGASLQAAVFGYTYLSSVLSDAGGLEEATHLAGSRIAIDTILSFKALPETFLRGCGVSQHEIEHFRSRSGRPIEFFSAFISYGHADARFAERLYAQLQGRGIRCWLDAHDMKPGDRILDAVSQAIRLHDRVLLCCSKTSLERWWVRDELRKAQERERREGRDIIVPILLDRYLLDEWNDGLATDLRSRRAADLTKWVRNERGSVDDFELLVNVLKAT